MSLSVSSLGVRRRRDRQPAEQEQRDLEAETGQRVLEVDAGERGDPTEAIFQRVAVNIEGAGAITQRDLVIN